MSNQVEVHVLNIQNNLDEGQFERLLSYVDAEKQCRVLRYRFFRDRQLSLLSDVLIRCLINHKLHISNHDISFHTHEGGKPYLCEYDCFYYNISHTDGYVACAIGEQEVGVDVENIGECNIDLARAFFHPEELDYLLKQPISNQASTFFDIWTKKESYIKYSGDGLKKSLKSFSVYSPEKSGVLYHGIFHNSRAICNLCISSMLAPKIFYMETYDLYELAIKNLYV